MKKIITITIIMLTVLTLSACTRTTQQNQPEKGNDEAGITTPSPTPTETIKKPTDQAMATFPPTNDQDVKAMDEMINKVDLNEYQEDSLNDLN